MAHFSRRGFLRLLGAAAAVTVTDPEKLLWRPGKLISIPPPRIPRMLFNPEHDLYGLYMRYVRVYKPNKDLWVTRTDALWGMGVPGEFRISQLQDPNTWAEEVPCSIVG